tara:strand:+ start:22502 stop:27085 length:4584 start_codon:yes stop_codon:yes gene_type:complete
LEQGRNHSEPGERVSSGVSVVEADRRHDPTATVTSLFLQAARANPTATAVVAGDRRLNYQEVEAFARSIADGLRASGVVPGDRVAVRCGRHPLMPSALIGILGAGGVFVPVDPDTPSTHAGPVLERAGCRVIVGTGASTIAGMETLDLDTVSPGLDRQTPGSEWVAPRLPGDAASVMFTSGSTGAPKGAVIPHRAIVRLCQRPNFLDFGPSTRFLQMAPLAFDASTLEVWAPLLNGGRVVLAPDRSGLREIARLIRDEGVNTAWLTAALFHLCVDEQAELFAPLSAVLTGGDVVSPTHAARLRDLCPKLRIINGYGPTENTTFTTCHEIGSDVDRGAPIPIGNPVSGTGVCIVDEELRPVPRGMPGELVATGDGLALGYLDDPSETERRFVNVPGLDRRGYRTGDRAMMDADGRVAFLGRLDDQFKVRGFRVEPAEIERAIRRDPSVRDAAVVRVAKSSDHALQAFVVLIEDADWAATRRRLTGALASELPPHLVPSFFARRGTLPIGSTGKIDRAMLREQVERGWLIELPYFDSHGPEGAAALSAAAAILAQRWQPDDGLAHATLAWGDRAIHLERPLGHETPRELAARIRAAAGEVFPSDEPLRIMLTDPEGGVSEVRRDGGLRLRMNPETSEDVARWRSEHLRRALAATAEQTQRPADECDILGDDERHQIERVWNGTDWDHGESLSLIDVFERAAAQHADRPALADASTQLSYDQLRRRVHAVAAQLRDAGVQPGDRVAIMDHRDAASVIGVLGILRLGAACVPLNPETPAGRREAMLTGCDARFLLLPGDAAVVGATDDLAIIPMAPLTDDAVVQESLDRVPVASDAFVLFTSGSSGTPKAVPIRHESLVNRVLWMTRAFGISPEDTVAQKNRLAWDVSMWEYLWPLTSGARVFVLDAESASDPKRLVAAANAHRISVWHMIPSLLVPLARAIRGVQPSSLRLTICSGEVLTPTAAGEYLRTAPGLLFNLYGPTEAAIDVTNWECVPGSDSVPIGRPIVNTRVRILDRSGRLCPMGVAGEIELEGVQVSDGYLNADSDAFSTVPDPGGSGSMVRRYRTGDLGWWREDGAIGFIGRQDAQVQLLGFRIEVTEIESAILLVPIVADAAACMVGHGVDAQIVAVCVHSGPPGNGDAESTIRAALRATLESHMVPTRFVWTDSIPRLANGKIDRRFVATLADPPKPEAGLDPVQASDPIVLVRRAWAKTLGRPPASDQDGFLRAGGNSLALLRLLLEIESALGLELPVTPTLPDPTPEAIAEMFERAMLQDRGEQLHGAALRRNASGHLHKLSDGGRVVVVLPHLGGAIGFLADAARACEGRVSIYAIQPAGLLENEDPLRSVFEMVHGYADLIEAQGWGRVTIAGFSSGAPLALELANEIKRRSIGVAELIAIDGIPAHRPPVPDPLARAYGKLRRIVPPGRMPLWSPGPRHRKLAEWEPLQRALGAATLEALYRHRPGRYEGPALVIRRKNTDLGLGLDSWRRVLRGPAREVLIDCDSHMGIWRNPHNASIVNAFINGADQGSE